MRNTNILFLLLPVIGVLIDFTVGYPALSWIVESLPITFIPLGILVLFTSICLVIVELILGASREPLLYYVGWAIVSIVPLFSIAEGFNKYTESVLLELPQSDIYRILITQAALVILTSCVHILIIVKAKHILSIYTNEELATDESGLEYDTEQENFSISLSQSSQAEAV